MTGFDYYKKVAFDNYANFEGRARRSEYWYFVLFHLIIIYVSSFIIGIISSIIGATGYLLYFIILLYVLVMLVPSLAVGVRRLHDTDKSGWIYLIGLIPLVGAILLLIFFATESTPGRNQYGDNPKEEPDTESDIEDQLV